jgi:hypothetical protein
MYQPELTSLGRQERQPVAPGGSINFLDSAKEEKMFKP